MELCSCTICKINYTLHHVNAFTVDNTLFKCSLYKTSLRSKVSYGVLGSGTLQLCCVCKMRVHIVISAASSTLFTCSLYETGLHFMKYYVLSEVVSESFQL